MIVADATILITLINIDSLELLKKFVPQIIIPPEVYDEVACRPYAGRRMDQEIREGFVSVEPYGDETIFRELLYILDAGESAAMTLAIERKLPLIIDEKKGRAVARRQGIEIVGLVGILRFLYSEGRISREETKEIVDRLNRSDFRISKELLALILA
jgi:predicted nucleic acid-binding protein